MPKRDNFRPGVVYGPQGGYGGRGRGAILGSLLGFLVVVATVGVLGFGLILFLESRNNPGSPAPTNPGLSSPGASPATPGLSPGASVPASAQPTIGPSSAPTSSPPPTATPAPTVFVPDVQVGPGYVTFGTKTNGRLDVTDPRATFGPSETMVWSAYLAAPADSVDLEIRILKLDPVAPDGQRLVRVDPVKPKATNAQRFVRTVRVKRVLAGPGLYTIQYVRSGEIVAEGSFLVLDAAPSGQPG